jgi:hypothetical protein
LEINALAGAWRKKYDSTASKSRSGPILICRRPFDVIEDENLDGAGLWFEAKAELVVQILPKLGKRLLAVGIREINVLGRVFEGEIVGARETCLI